MEEKIEGDVKYRYLSHRGISAKTFEFYKAKVKLVDDEPHSIGFVYPNNSVKTRSFTIPKKERGHFKTQGDMSNAPCYGLDLFEEGSKKGIIIVEGEYDALAAYEMLQGEYAVISIKSSASAAKDVQRDYKKINSFDKIYFCFDNDEPGQAALAACVNIFDFNKVYQIKMEKYKDANDYLNNNDSELFKTIVEGAGKYSPSSIISTFGDIKKTLGKKGAEKIAEYPFEQVQNSLGGLYKGEFVLIKGKEGIGKTEVCRAICHKALSESKVKIATIFLEEDEGTTVKGVATYQLEMPAMRDDSGLSDDDIMNAYIKAVNGDDSRLYIHSHVSGDDESEIVENIRFLVKVAGCELIFLDNLTMLNSGREGDSDERLRIDRIIRRLRNLVNELKFCLVLIAHTNDDSVTTRGSRLPDIVANTVIVLERDKKDNKLFLDVRKARFQGAKTGPAGFALYDRDLFVLRDPTPREMEGGEVDSQEVQKVIDQITKPFDPPKVDQVEFNKFLDNEEELPDL